MGTGVDFMTLSYDVDPLAQPYVNATTWLADVDEVTVTNCHSAWYRWTFDLPACFRDASLSGRVNADHLGVVYLNGQRISPQIRQADVDAVMAGRFEDHRGNDGRPLLSAPTTDSFWTLPNESSHFRPGANELVFGVLLVGESPAGLEFTGEVRFELPADWDRDGDVDRDDFELFVDCASGPAVPVVAGCERKDLDGDGDVDQDDFGFFQRCYSGAGKAADPRNRG